MILLLALRNVVLFLVPAALVGVVSFRLVRTSRDEWQLLAWVPVLPLAGWGVFIAWGVTRDPTSHNLWPFELVFWSTLSAVLLVTFLVGRRVATRHDGDRSDRKRRGRTT